LAAGIEEVIVVDEVSADGSADRAVADPAVQLLRSDRPGFAAAINTGVAAARGDFVLLLGSDVFVREDTVARLVRRLEHDSGLAVCGAALVGEDGRPTKTYNALLTFSRALLDVFHIRTPVAHTGSGLTEVDAVYPNCALVRRDALAGIGGADERFLLYYGDADLCRRLARAGWRQAVD